MSVRRVIPLGFVALMLLVPHTVRAEISARLTTETASPFVYMPFTLRLEVECEATPETPEFPDVPDLAVTTLRRLPSDPAQRKHVFQIELISERDGIVTIPPFAVRAEGESTSTSALRLRIRKPRPATEMMLEVTVEPTTLRVGQPATVTVTWTSDVSFKRCKQLVFQIPLLADRRCHIYPLAAGAPEEGIGLPVNNVRVVAQPSTLGDGRQSLTFRYKLLPREPFVFQSPPARLLCALMQDEPSVGELPNYFYNHFFEAVGESEAYDEIYLAAPIPKITVRGLPEAGRTPRFAGIVGPCTLRTSVAPARLTVGQPALFTVHMNDLLFGGHIGGVPAAAFDGLRSEFQLSQEPIREDVSNAARSFTYTLRPLHAGITRIPAVVIQTFDPDSGTYRTLRSEPLSITVEAADEDESRTFAFRVDSQQPIALHGIRHNRLGGTMMTSVQNLLEFLGRSWWLFVALPPLAWCVLRPLARHWERCRRDPAYARATGAWWRYRRAVWRDEESAWRGYLADRLALHAEALTADTVAAALRRRNVSAELIAETRRHLEEKDAADYGKRPAASSRDTRNLVRQLQKATAGLLVMFGFLIPLNANAADGADALFARAMQLREDQPDEAQPLFVDAALRFEGEKRFLNAGNSWFFAGENGRALANYRAAERRAPFDRQVRESIEFLRANRADAFPASDALTSGPAAWWNRYCTWDPVLRAGSFVLVYLIVWAVFLTTQLAGRRIRRAVWIVLLALVVMPLVSLAQSSLQHAEGVVVEDAVARLGPGYAYDPAFKEPLHKATEFVWLETRRGWVHVRLPDDSEGWLRDSCCMRIP